MSIETREETTIRRIRVTGPYDEGGEVMNELHEDGWRIKRTGPYTDEEMHPEVDPDRFLIVAEKESDSPASGALESYVRVRLPVAVEPDGTVYFPGGGSYGDDEDKIAWLDAELDELPTCAKRAETVWINADVPVPTSREVEGDART